MKAKIIITFVGVIFCSLGLFVFSGNMELISSGIKTKGEVVQIVQVLDDEGDYLYYPVVKFADQAGKAMLFLFQERNRVISDMMLATRLN